jgi:hypothetical protein
MASRKTVFGIGVPQDPSSPESGPLPLSGGSAGDAEDRSSPTVVDDAKVAEGLKQLRSWYQGDGQDLTPDGIPVARQPRAVAAGSLARPTAVGHATAPPAAVQQQPRPFAPDPMRATMYGHDVHSFDVDPPSEASAAPSGAPPSSSTALVLASSAQEESALSVATPVPEPSRRGSSGSFQLAQQVQAERLQRPVGMRRSSQEMAAAVRPPISRTQLVSRLMFGGGLLALAVAVVMWFQSESGSDATPSAPVPTPPANVAPQPAWVPTPPPPEREAVKPTTQPATATERALVPAAMRARPGAPAPIAAPRGERALATPAVTRRRAPRVEVEKTDDGNDETPAEREPSEKKTEPAAAPEPPAPPVRKKEAPRRDRSRVGVDSDATMPPSED